MRNLLLLFLVLPLLFTIGNAQMDAQYTMYMFNRQALNPAYTGSLEATNMTLLGRAQWVGIPGAPKTSTFAVSGFLKGINSGIGGHIIADQIGPLRTLGANLAYAYHLHFSDRAILNIGIQGGFYQKGLFVPKDGWLYAEMTTNTDPLANTGDATSFVPDIGSGLYFHLKRRGITTPAYPQDAFYVGGSVGHILEPSLKGLILNGNSIARVRRSFNATVGGSIPIKRNIFLGPSAFFRTDLASWQLDLTTNLYISPMVFGINYRGGLYNFQDSNFRNVSDSFSGIVGFNANTSLFIGYSYDYTVSPLTQFTSGSHELIISYTFPTITRPDIRVLDPTMFRTDFDRE